MITYTKLGNSGRLGNQLWQIASTLGIARLFNEEVCFPRWAYEQFFSVPEDAFVDVPSGRESDDAMFLPHMDERARPYLQDFGLWKDIQWEIVEWFTPTVHAKEILATRDQLIMDLPRPILSVHVRRGDNVTEGEWKKQYHPPCQIGYYDEAIRLLDGQFQSIAIFSDDPEWCKTAFDKYRDRFPLEVFEGTPRPKEHEPNYTTAPVLDWIDLQIMTFCDLHVLSNSSYSWWGAYLSGDDMPIYPWPFFGPKLTFTDATLMFPSSWIKVGR